MTLYRFKQRIDRRMDHMLIDIKVKAHIYGPEPDLLPNICKRIPINKI